MYKSALGPSIFNLAMDMLEVAIDVGIKLPYRRLGGRAHLHGPRLQVVANIDKL